MKRYIGVILSFFKQLKISNLLKSLRARFFIIVFLTGLFSCVIMHILILQSYEDRAVNVNSTGVQTQLRILANHLITNEYFTNTSSEVVNAELEMLTTIYDGRVMVINNVL